MRAERNFWTESTTRKVIPNNNKMNGHHYKTDVDSYFTSNRMKIIICIFLRGNKLMLIAKNIALKTIKRQMHTFPKYELRNTLAINSITHIYIIT